jgi:hypothetical protein
MSAGWQVPQVQEGERAKVD